MLGTQKVSGAGVRHFCGDFNARNSKMPKIQILVRLGNLQDGLQFSVEQSHCTCHKLQLYVYFSED